MKTSLYIIGSLVFGALILINKPLPREPSFQFEIKKREMSLKEKHLNQTITELEADLAMTNALIQIKRDSIKDKKK